MESSQTYFCHTCKTDLNLAYLLNKDEEPTCSKCGEFFIEMLESTEQLTALKALYPVSQSVPSNANGPSLVSQSNPNSNQNRRPSDNSDEQYFDCVDDESKINEAIPKISEESKEESKEEAKQSTTTQPQQNTQATSQPQVRVQSQTYQLPNGSIVNTTFNVLEMPSEGQGAQFDLLQQQINQLIGLGGQTQTINQNGQNINVTSLNRQFGNTQVHIANIQNNFPIDANADDSDLNDDPLGILNQIDLEVDLMDIDQQVPFNSQPFNPQQQQQQPPLQQQQSQQQQQQQPRPQQNRFIPSHIHLPQDQYVLQPENQPIWPLPWDLYRQHLPHLQYFRDHPEELNPPQQNAQQPQPNPQPSHSNEQQPGQQQPQQQSRFQNVRVINMQNLINPFVGMGQDPNQNQQIFNGPFPHFQPNFMNNLFGGLQNENNILNQVMQESMNLYYRNMNFGIPASKAWVEKLEVLPGSSFDPKPDCLICQETYANEDSILKLTCNHMFHKDCVRSWLDKHNTCPVCRAEFPTDDLEYENRKRQQQSNDPLADFITGNNNSNNNNRNNGGNNNGNNNGGQPSFSSSYHS